MDCREAREGLWPPERPRLVEDGVAHAKAHVDACPQCQAYFAQDRALLDVYDRVRQERAPVGVRERVFDALAASRSATGRGAPTRRWKHARALLAAAIAAVVLVTIGERVSDPPVRNDAGIFAEDYLRRAVAQDHIVTTDPDEVQRFLQRELGMHVLPIRLAGLVLERVEICLIEGRRGALIVYKKDGAAISHYLVPRDDARKETPAVADYRTGPTGARMPVITWSSPRVEQALVGEVAADELLRIASNGVT